MDKLRRLGLRARGEVPNAAWLILLAVFVTEYWWWHSRVRLWDGDALYYVAAALKFAGHSTDEALRHTGVFFHQEGSVERIRGTLTGVAGQPGAGAHDLEAPRFFYSVLAVPFIWVFGAKGIWVAVVPVRAAFLFVTMRLLTRLFGVQLALAMLVLYQIAYSFWFFQTGIYTESLAALLIVLILTRLPLERTATRNDLVGIGVLLRCWPSPGSRSRCRSRHRLRLPVDRGPHQDLGKGERLEPSGAGRRRRRGRWPWGW